MHTWFHVQLGRTLLCISGLAKQTKPAVLLACCLISLWFVTGVTPTARSLVPRGLSSVKVFPPFDPPARTFRATGVIFSEASGSNYGFIVVVTFETECRECDQIITGRNFAYRRALEVIQNEEYVNFMDFDDEIRKKRDLEVKNTKKYAQLLGSNKKSRTKRQTGEGFLSVAPPECSIIPRCN